MRARRTIAGAAALALALVLGPGCIERTLVIESDPPGADVRLNGIPVGATPVRVAFRHYGVYEVELRKELHEIVVDRANVLAPAYARFPLCLFTELLWPGRIRDERRLFYTLGPPREVDRAGLLEAASRAVE